MKYFTVNYTDIEKNEEKKIDLALQKVMCEKTPNFLDNYFQAC